MATKTFRSIYLDNELDKLLLDRARQEDSSASRLVRQALEKFLDVSGNCVNEAAFNHYDDGLAIKA